MSLAPKESILGAGFLLCALFCGVLGGGLALPVFRLLPTSGILISHAVLMTFFVICPAFLGGIAQWYLPQALKSSGMMLPSFSVAGLILLIIGGMTLPLSPVVGLALWAISMFAVACNVIATILEGREILFRELSPLGWSFLATASALIVINPILLALLVKGTEPLALVHVLRMPEISLAFLPSLGLMIETLIGPLHHRGRVVKRLAPYMFGLMGGGLPLCWANTLFGGIPSHMLTTMMVLGQMIPALILLFSACIESWSLSASPHWAGGMWLIGAIVLLMMSCGVLWLPHVVAKSVQSNGYHLIVGHDGIGYQVAILGSLMALSGAFYLWFSHIVPLKAMWFEIVGALHAGVTLMGMIGLMIPMSESYASLALCLSLCGFIMMGVVAWRCFVQRCVMTHAMVSLKRN